MEISSTSNQFLQELIQNLHSRKLQYAPLYQPDVPAASPSIEHIDPTNFQRELVFILSVVLCVIVCSLGIFSMIRSVLKCSSRVSADSNANRSARLANKGVKPKVLKSFPTVNYSDDRCELPENLDKECAICLSEFAPGEPVRVMPKCSHGFHVICVDKWLNSHSSCPICRDNVIERTQRVIGCRGQTSSSVVPTSGDSLSQDGCSSIIVHVIK